MDKHFIILLEVVIWIFVDLCASAPLAYGSLSNIFMIALNTLLLIVIQIIFVSIIIFIIRTK